MSGDEVPTYEELMEDVEHLRHIVRQIMHLLSHVPLDVLDTAAAEVMHCDAQNSAALH